MLTSNIAFGTMNPLNYLGKLNAINDIKQIINRAIGKLEAERKSWNISINGTQKLETTPRRKKES